MTMPEPMEAAIPPAATAIKLEETGNDGSYPQGVENAANLEARQIDEENGASVELAPGPSAETQLEQPAGASPPATATGSDRTTTEGEPLKIEGESHAADLAALPLDAPLVLQSRPADAPAPQALADIPELSPLITRRDVARRDLPMYCHVIGCNLGLAAQAEYYQRYRICKDHLRAAALLVDGIPQRFCQQCGRFHNLDAFDADKRNCRARLAQHNSRRRKAGAAPGVMPYGQGQGARRRTYLEYDRYDEDYEVDLEDLRQRQRARTASANDFSAAAGRGGPSDGPDVGLLDQLVAAAVGMEEEDAMDYDDGAQNGVVQELAPVMAPPPRVMSRPVERDLPGDGNAGGRGLPGMTHVSQSFPTYPEQMPNFGGWRPGSVQFKSAPPPQPPHPVPRPQAPPPPAGAPNSAIAELEQLLGRQLLQQLLTSAGMQVNLPPPPPPTEPGAQLMDMLRTLAGGVVAAARPQMPAPPPQQYFQQQQQQQQVYRQPPPPAPAPVARGYGPETGGQSDRLGAAAGSLEALKQLMSNFQGGRTATPPPPSLGQSMRPPLPPQPQNGSIIEQLAAALKTHTQAAKPAGQQQQQPLQGPPGPLPVVISQPALPRPPPVPTGPQFSEPVRPVAFRVGQGKADSMMYLLNMLQSQPNLPKSPGNFPQQLAALLQQQQQHQQQQQQQQQQQNIEAHPAQGTAPPGTNPDVGPGPQ